MSVHVFENSEVPDRNKAYGNHSERSCLRHLEGLCYLGYPLDDTVPGIRLRVRGTGEVGGGRGRELRDLGQGQTHPSLPEITNTPTHQRRIIKNNLHKLSVVRALFFFFF